MKPLSIVFAFLVTVYIVLSIVVVPPSEARDFNFVDERGAITAMSAMFLAMGSGFGFATFLVSKGHPKTTVRSFWLMVALALGLLTLDELLQFHERIGSRLDGIDPLGLTSSGTIRTWNDIIVILYGVGAVVAAAFVLPTMLRYRSFLKLISVAFAAYVMHTAIDSTIEPATTLSVMLEESAKLYCSLFVALACLSGLLVHATKKSATTSESCDTPGDGS